MQASIWGWRIIFQYTNSGEMGVLFSSIKKRGMFFFQYQVGSVAYVRDVQYLYFCFFSFLLPNMSGYRRLSFTKIIFFLFFLFIYQEVISFFIFDFTNSFIHSFKKNLLINSDYFTISFFQVVKYYLFSFELYYPFINF